MVINQKKWEDLELKDDFMFAKVMRDPELCKEMLERLLGFKITKIHYPEEQKSIDITYDSRGVRLDLYVEDDADTVYNVEIQTTDTKELPKRSRYYQGMIDLNLIEKGEPYRKLNTSYVIFICTFDLFGKGYYRYSFENICKEDTTVTLQDKAIKVFFNTEGTADDVSEEAKAFLRYVGGIPTDDVFTRKLEEKVRKVKNNEEWRREYMTLLMRDKMNIEQGIEQGIEKEKERMVRAMLRRAFPEEEIMAVSGISAAQLTKIRESMD